MSNLCIIPARGGSKRIPRKNIKDFLGKPIIAYSIEAALKSDLFDEVIVSTDDQEIAQVATRYGARVPFMRSEENSNDFATLSDVIEEVKVYYSSNDKHFDNICCILSTVPFVTCDLLSRSLIEMQDKNLDSIRPIIRFSYPPQRGVKLENGRISFLNAEFAKSRSQDLQPIYHDAGMFYWMTYETGLIGVNRGGIVISEKDAQDIDSLEDWHLAEIKYKIFRNE